MYWDVPRITVRLLAHSLYETGSEFSSSYNTLCFVANFRSRTGIHGNENQNIQVLGVTFRDFEVAAVALNNVDGLVIADCHVQTNRRDVPVNGMYSAGRFIR